MHCEHFLPSASRKYNKATQCVPKILDATYESADLYWTTELIEPIIRDYLMAYYWYDMNPEHISAKDLVPPHCSESYPVFGVHLQIFKKNIHRWDYIGEKQENNEQQQVRKPFFSTVLWHITKYSSHLSLTINFQKYQIKHGNIGISQIMSQNLPTCEW